jgi:hypothetical protein
MRIVQHLYLAKKNYLVRQRNRPIFCLHHYFSRELISFSFRTFPPRPTWPLTALCAKTEYCKAYGYPPPRFFDALDDSGDAAQVGVRYKVWVVLGSERLELPTSYAGINEGEEMMARKVLRHLRSREVGGATRVT